jgi:hypothetical protein
MGLTYEYLKSQTASGLWMKVSEEYDGHHAEVKGGSLFLYLLIRQLMADNDAIFVALAERLKD